MQGLVQSGGGVVVGSETPAHWVLLAFEIKRLLGPDAGLITYQLCGLGPAT